MVNYTDVFQALDLVKATHIFIKFLYQEYPMKDLLMISRYIGFQARHRVKFIEMIFNSIPDLSFQKSKNHHDLHSQGHQIRVQ
jgi:hypothetical protein